jgi:hypothetical protein
MNTFEKAVRVNRSRMSIMKLSKIMMVCMMMSSIKMDLMRIRA